MKRVASYAGFHVHQVYQSCRRQFYFTHVLNLKPKHTPPPLTFGSAFHEGKATFYTTGSEAKALKVGKQEITSRLKEFEDAGLGKDSQYRVVILLQKWIQEYGKYDLQNGDILGVELELEAPIPNLKGFKATGRADLVIRYPNLGVIINDTKTTGFSISLTDEVFFNSDQATMYTWLVEHNLKVKVAGVRPDIACWSWLSKNPSDIRYGRGSIVRRTKEDVDEYKKGLTQLASEISQRITAVKNGTDPLLAFERNTANCIQYNRVCPFLSICRTSVSAESIPGNFKRGDSKKNKIFREIT